MYNDILFDKKGKPKGKAHISEKDKVITFPSGAKSKFAYLLYDKDADAYYGSEITKVYIDELQSHTEYAFTVLRSRNRSRADVPKGMRFTLNPDPNHWMYEWIEPFLLDDDSGLPDMELSGKVRYFVIIGGTLYTSWDKEKLKETHGKNPQTYTYVPATLKDNKVLQELDPEYYDVLDSMPEAKRNQLLLGSWKKVDDTTFFDRNWLEEADEVPAGSVSCRAWDKAGSVPSETYRYPDYTAGIKMSRDKDGFIYISGDFHPEVKDEDNIGGRFRKLAGDRDTLIRKQAEYDGKDCKVILAKDSGSAGQTEYLEASKKLMAEGFIVKPDPMPNNQNKVKKGEPFVSACQNGHVRIVTSSFPDKATLESYLKELESFNGERSTSRRKDDRWDCTCTAYNFISQEKNIPSFKMAGGLTQDNPFSINMRGR